MSLAGSPCREYYLKPIRILFKRSSCWWALLECRTTRFIKCQIYYSARCSPFNGTAWRSSTLCQFRLTAHSEQTALVSYSDVTSVLLEISLNYSNILFTNTYNDHHLLLLCIFKICSHLHNEMHQRLQRTATLVLRPCSRVRMFKRTSKLKWRV